LVIVEAWQTALTDSSIDIAYDLNIPVLMISHGISIYPYSLRLSDLIRFLAWWPYKVRKLSSRIGKLSAITCLDSYSKSTRFYDRDIALKLNIPLLELVNSPVHTPKTILPRAERKLQILVIGYFSEVKNQLDALDILSHLPEDLEMRFIGRRTGGYYLKCLKHVKKLKIEKRVIFSEDNECNIAEEISKSLLILNTSITEALPVTLLEAMASGTPFVASPVGATPSLDCGVIVSNKADKKRAILSLMNDINYWNKVSTNGLTLFKNRYTEKHVKFSLSNAVLMAVNYKIV